MFQEVIIRNYLDYCEGDSNESIDVILRLQSNQDKVTSSENLEYLIDRFEDDDIIPTSDEENKPLCKYLLDLTYFTCFYRFNCHYQSKKGIAY